MNTRFARWVCRSLCPLAVCACGDGSQSAFERTGVAEAQQVPFAPDPCSSQGAEAACDGHASQACGWVSHDTFQSCVSLFGRTFDASRNEVLLVLPERRVTLEELSLSALTAVELQQAQHNRQDIIAAFRGEAATEDEVDHHNSNYCGHGSRYEQIITLVSYFNYRNVYCGTAHCHDHLNMHYHPFSDHGQWRTCGTW